MIAILACALIVAAVAILIVRVSHSRTALVAAALALIGCALVAVQTWKTTKLQQRTEASIDKYCDAVAEQLEDEVREYRLTRAPDSGFEPRDAVMLKRMYVRIGVERHALLDICVPNWPSECLPPTLDDSALARIEQVASALRLRQACPPLK